jgi:5-methyltetrahydrofolate--homocysteine methyltransferase
MVTTAQDLKANGIDVPILVGGAALTRKFTKDRIGPEYDGLVLYAKDAMNGLDLANQITNPEQRQLLVEEMIAYKNTPKTEDAGKKDLPQLTRVVRSNTNQHAPVFTPPDLERHVLKNYPVSHILPYVNMQMLLGHHLGVKGTVEQLIEDGDKKTVELKAIVDDLYAEAMREGYLQAHGMYQFFPAQSEGNDVIVYDPKDTTKVLQRFSFPRQKTEPFLCLADFLKSVESGVMDYVGFLVVTAGQNIRERATEMKDNGDYLRSHALQALALETAEGFAERVHHMMRDIWGFPDSAEMTMKQRFGARYQGVRVSFGYPACPNLEDQELLFSLLNPADIGIELTEGFMMEPEASVSAMVFAHPEGKYFNVEKAE